MTGKGGSRVAVPREAEAQITLEELALDFSAFIHFLSENFEGEKGSDLPSFWMLIPNSIDVEWREGTSGFFLEKEVFSRKLWIVAAPVAESERDQRRVELLLMFQNTVAEDQTRQIMLLLSRLREDSRRAMIEKFTAFKTGQNRSRK